MFGGWELLHDARSLTRLGSGHLTIDVLRGTCRYNQRWIAPLVIAGVLRSRLTAALADLAIPIESITAARLDVRLELRERSESKKRDTVWVGAGQAFMGCALEMRGEVTSGDGTSAVSEKAWQEWPREWGDR